MANVFLKINEEEEFCGGCDTMRNEDGCECRTVTCCECGIRDSIYNMEHPLKHLDDWDCLPMCDKIHEFVCVYCSVDGAKEEELTFD